MLGAGWIAGRAILPAMHAATRVQPFAIASRDAQRAAAMASSHGVERVHPSYEALLADDEVEAVYIGLANSLHLPWTLRALDAGKHVLCEKPLGCNAAEAHTMAAAAAAAERVLMEALMYRFHPRMRALRERVGDVRHAHAAFSFRLNDAANYRMDAGMGGGVLLDVGCYALDAVRWFCGEPDVLAAVAHAGAVDIDVAAALRFASGSTASVWVSFAAPEHQTLTLVTADETVFVETPFTAWRDPHDPYALMLDAFAAAVLDGGPPPLPLEETIATAELIDRVRAAARG